MQAYAKEPRIASIGYRDAGELKDAPLTRNKGSSYLAGGHGGTADTPLHIGSRQLEGESDDVLRKPRIEATEHIDKQIEKKTKQLNTLNMKIIKDQDFVDRMHYLVYEDSPGPVNIEHLAVLTDDTYSQSHGGMPVRHYGQYEQPLAKIFRSRLLHLSLTYTVRSRITLVQE